MGFHKVQSVRTMQSVIRRMSTVKGESREAGGVGSGVPDSDGWDIESCGEVGKRQVFFVKICVLRLHVKLGVKLPAKLLVEL